MICIRQNMKLNPCAELSVLKLKILLRLHFTCKSAWNEHNEITLRFHLNNTTAAASTHANLKRQNTTHDKSNSIYYYIQTSRAVRAHMVEWYNHTLWACRLHPALPLNVTTITAPTDHVSWSPGERSHATRWADLIHVTEGPGRKPWYE